MSPLIRIARRYGLTGSRLVVAYALMVVTVTLVATLYHAARTAG